ncbi:MAG: hypothetical protein FWG11_04495, partial [Promicromonosporaceae bacterium]|nr:hypothetical protein [Promicromonosporaceae bacterium]
MNTEANDQTKPARRRVTRPAGAASTALLFQAPTTPLDLPEPRIDEAEPVQPVHSLAEIVLPEASARAMFMAPDLSLIPPAPPVVIDEEAEIEEPAPVVAPAKPRRLSKAEYAAAKGVSVIEEELVAEGMEILALEEADLVEDSEDVEIVGFDELRSRRRRRGGRGRRASGEDGPDAEAADGAAAEVAAESPAPAAEAGEDEHDDETGSSRRRRRRSRQDRAERSERQERTERTERTRPRASARGTAP